jgi:hypothetical protein
LKSELIDVNVLFEAFTNKTDGKGAKYNLPLNFSNVLRLRDGGIQGGATSVGATTLRPPCPHLCGVIQISDLTNDTHAQLPQILIWAATTAAYFLGGTRKFGVFACETATD